MTDSEFDTKAQFIEVVREDGAILDDVEYFTEGEGSSTTYYARNKSGDEEQVTKSEIKAVWEAIQEEGRLNIWRAADRVSLGRVTSMPCWSSQRWPSSGELNRW